jgi:uncharacterized membrane protein
MNANALRPVLSVLMVSMGVLHFTHGEVFASIMPPYLPFHLACVYISGAAEIALGVMLSVERTRMLAAWGLIALFVAVYPANIHMALHPDLTIAGAPAWLPRPSPLAAWLRLPFQFGLIYWAWLYTREERTAARVASAG